MNGSVDDTPDSVPLCPNLQSVVTSYCSYFFKLESFTSELLMGRSRKKLAYQSFPSVKLEEYMLHFDTITSSPVGCDRLRSSFSSLTTACMTP
jgi:hypothetical protein